MIFADAILRGQPINVFNHGDMSRDFTYIDDVVDAIYKCCLKTSSPNINFYDHKPEPSSSFAPYKIFNVGSNNPTNLLNFIKLLETSLGVKAIKKMTPMQPGDVKSTYADINKIKDWINFSPKTSLTEGIIKQMIKELKLNKNDYIIIGTGGFAEIINNQIGIFDSIDQNLTLDGMRIIYNLNKK